MGPASLPGPVGHEEVAPEGKFVSDRVDVFHRFWRVKALALNDNREEVRLDSTAFFIHDRLRNLIAGT